jgi:hypothetical protein
MMQSELASLQQRIQGLESKIREDNESMKRLRGKKNDQLKGIMKTTAAPLSNEKVSFKIKKVNEKKAERERKYTSKDYIDSEDEEERVEEQEEEDEQLLEISKPKKQERSNLHRDSSSDSIDEDERELEKVKQ